ncbi:MAG: M23 family metallopeptidase [Anaerolineales bacterium]|nr:M23 family metallopeptidase [Anaerolineales bacterium]
MKKSLFLLALLFSSCNFPSPAEPTSSAVETQISPTQTTTPTVPPTFTLLPPTQTPTSTPIPCNPLSADYCITAGSFLFQRPILPPDNDKVDITYLYASTQNGARDPHHGVEFQNPFGTSVYAAGDGVVVFADSDKMTKFSPWTNFYGNVVIIHHAGDFYTLYAHLSNISVTAMSDVKAGDKVGEVGQTGGATGSHLHFEVRLGSDFSEYFSTQNPELWLIPRENTGTLSITLQMESERNIERPLVVTRFFDGNPDPVFKYYLTSYAKGFEHNTEDAVLGSLPPGQYEVAFNDVTGLKKRLIQVEAGKLTEVVFQVK